MKVALYTANTNPASGWKSCDLVPLSIVVGIQMLLVLSKSPNLAAPPYTINPNICKNAGTHIINFNHYTLIFNLATFIICTITRIAVTAIVIPASTLNPVLACFILSRLLQSPGHESS